MNKYQFRSDQVHPTVLIAQGAVIVGDVTLSEDCGVWFNATMRGDNEPITIGPRTNIQEGAIFHVDPGFPVVVGTGVTIGHGAIIHGARIGDNTVIGMGAIVLNGAEIGANSIVGAGALVTQGKLFPAESLIIGSPARVVRSVTPEEIEQNRQSARHYVERARTFRESLK
ncbi:gamma carbonic anhydrase family protein [Chloroflexi bacterium TSY]|nr:gamma carbonic anhydrase family protein [Chloroflexi bacterium TSY]